MVTKKYKEGEKYFEVQFQIPMKDGDLRAEIEGIVDKIFAQFPEAVNVQALRCSIYKEPSRLSVSMQSSGYTIHNPKQESQVIEEALPKVCESCDEYERCDHVGEVCDDYIPVVSEPGNKNDNVTDKDGGK